MLKLIQKYIFNPILLLICSNPVFAQHQFSEEAITRNHIYAPWDPTQIESLRKQVGLVGPGPQNAIPGATFPDYLKQPNTVEELMPQAQAAVIQKGGRSPLGLAEPGDIVLIVVPYDSDKLIQEAIIHAFS